MTWDRRRGDLQAEDPQAVIDSRPASPRGSALRSAAAWAAGREIWPLMAGVLLATVSMRWALWGLCLLALLWLLRWPGCGSPSVRTLVDGPALVLLALVPVTLSVTVDRALTLAAVSRLLAGLALAYGLANWATGRHRLHRFLPALSGLGLCLALAGLIGAEWPQDKLFPAQIYRWTRSPSGLFARLVDPVNANLLGGALALTVPFAFAGLIEAVASYRTETPIRSWVSLGGYGLAAGVGGTVLLLTQSRGAWAGAAAAGWLLLVFHWRSLAWLALPALPGAAWLVWRAVSGLVAEGRAGQMGRFELWSRAVYLIQDMPFTGVGAGAFEPILDTQFPFYLHGSWVEHAHSLFLQVGVDLGVPGLIAFLALLLLALWGAVDAAFRLRQAGERALAVLAWASLASLVAMLVHGLVDAPTWIVSRSAYLPWAIIGTIPWAAVGTILALHRRAHDLELQSTGREHSAYKNVETP